MRIQQSICLFPQIPATQQRSVSSFKIPVGSQEESSLAPIKNFFSPVSAGKGGGSLTVSFRGKRKNTAVKSPGILSRKSRIAGRRSVCLSPPVREWKGFLHGTGRIHHCSADSRIFNSAGNFVMVICPSRGVRTAVHRERITSCKHSIRRNSMEVKRGLGKGRYP